MAVITYRKTDIDFSKGICFVGQGGAIRSCVFTGALQALEDNNIPVSMVCGDSMSSLIASLISCGITADAIQKLFLENNKKITDATKKGGRGSIVIQETVNNEIKRLTGRTEDPTFNNTIIPCYINACYFKGLKPIPIVFSRKQSPDTSLGEACRASASLPFLFGSYEMEYEGNTKKMYDGGFAENPHIPETDLPIIYVGFNLDHPTILDKVSRAIAKKSFGKSDIFVDVPIGKTPSLGTNKDMDYCFDQGYIETVLALRRYL